MNLRFISEPAYLTAQSNRCGFGVTMQLDMYLCRFISKVSRPNCRFEADAQSQRAAQAIRYASRIDA
jgi:hypothetical protein